VNTIANFNTSFQKYFKYFPKNCLHLAKKEYNRIRSKPKIREVSQMAKIITHKTAYIETAKAIGFTMTTGVTGRNTGVKWFPKSKIQMNFGKYADQNTVEIIVPDWLMKNINAKNRLECAEIE
jgi:hypothetical protein